MIELGVSWKAKKLKKSSVGATGLVRLVAQMVLGQRNGDQNECSRGGNPLRPANNLAGLGHGEG